MQFIYILLIVFILNFSLESIWDRIEEVKMCTVIPEI